MEQLARTNGFKMAPEPVNLTDAEVEIILENARRISQQLAKENPFLLPDHVRGVQTKPIIHSGNLDV